MPTVRSAVRSVSNAYAAKLYNAAFRAKLVSDEHTEIGITGLSSTDLTNFLIMGADS